MKNLVSLRKESNMSQLDLANLLGVSQQTVSKYENGIREPDNATLKKLAEIFNCSADYLLGITNIKKPTDKITNSLKEDKELLEFWNDLKEREELQLLFKQTRELDKKAIQQVIRIIKAIEDEESRG